MPSLKNALLAATGLLASSAISQSAASPFDLSLTQRDSSLDFATCDCGFVDAADPNEGVFTTYYRMDFTSESLTSDNITKLFRISSSTIDKTDSGSPYMRWFSPQQVSLNTSGLSLTVSPPNATDAVAVPCAAIYSKQETFGFGSYHLNAQVTNETGTVSAFFVYKNDTSEVDMEYVSKVANSSNLQFLRESVKPQVYLANGAASNETYATDHMPGSGSISDTAHEWAFSWTPDSVTFALDGVYKNKLSTNIPQDDGLFALAHWSDGGPTYSQGPPTANATLLITQLWALHNSSATDLPNASVNGQNSTTSAMTCQKMKSPCYVLKPSGTDNGLSLSKTSSTASASTTSSTASATGSSGSNDKNAAAASGVAAGSLVVATVLMAVVVGLVL